MNSRIPVCSAATPDISSIRAGPVLRHGRLSGTNSIPVQGTTTRSGQNDLLCRANRPRRRYTIVMTICGAIVVRSYTSAVAAIATVVAEYQQPASGRKSSLSWLIASLIIFAISFIFIATSYLLRGKMTRAEADGEQWFELQHRDKNLPPSPPLGGLWTEPTPAKMLKSHVADSELGESSRKASRSSGADSAWRLLTRFRPAPLDRRPTHLPMEIHDVIMSREDGRFPTPVVFHQRISLMDFSWKRTLCRAARQSMTINRT